MEIKYIVAITTLCLFVVILLIVAIITYHRKKEEWDRQIAIEKSLENPRKMEYDFAVYDEETERLLARGGKNDGQLTIDDVIGKARDNVDIFGKIKTEGVEEITGNYRPE